MASPASPSWVSFIHPAIATAGLLLSWLALRRGLELRDARLKRPPLTDAARARHLGVARPGAGLVVLSFPVGLASAVLVRDFKALHTAHGWVAAVASACFLGGSVVGVALVRGERERRSLHVALSVAGAFLGLVAGLTGIELLP